MNRDSNFKPILDSDGNLMQALRELPERVPPPSLRTSLRVVASRERQRILQRRTLRDWLTTWKDRLELTAKNLMRPLALPFAGGVFSTITLFSLWVVPAYPVVMTNHATDVPTALSTSVTVDGSASTGASGAVPVASIIVELSVDGQGRMVDYSVVSGDFQNDKERRSLENFLLFTRFVPATSFGKPTSGKMRLQLASARIDVKG